MMIRVYLRASTKDQNASRAEHRLEQFLHERNLEAGRFYLENESGVQLNRPELMKLINQAKKGDVLLVEQVDRLSRLNDEDWETLKRIIGEKGIKVISLDLPTSWMLLEKQKSSDFMESILKAINGMLLDMLAAIARKDQEDRKRRQKDGVVLAKEQGRYKGRKPDIEKHRHIIKLRSARVSIDETVKITGCSRSTVLRTWKLYKQEKVNG